MKLTPLCLAGFAASLVAVSSASAVLIDNPLSLQTPFLVGLVEGQPANSNPDTELGYAQAILDLSLGEIDGAYKANTLFNFGGTITLNGGQSGSDFSDPDDTVSIPAGWRWVLVKYDGDNAGSVLFALGNQASTIPEYPWNLWTTNQAKWEISHYTLFDGPVPPPGDDPPDDDPPSVPDGGSMLIMLGAGLGGLELLRRTLLRASLATI